jgi:putative SOS response-associated peptidase YedK
VTVAWLFCRDDTRRYSVGVSKLTLEEALFAFGGLRTEFRGDRGTKSKPIPGPHLVYGFLTTALKATVEPIHPKAMPVILTTDEERDMWMSARGMRRGRCSGRCLMRR